MKKTRIYRNKNYWINECIKQSFKLPSVRLKELITDNCWDILQKEIPIIQRFLNKL